MAKATLEFDLDDHSDKLAHRRAVSATGAFIALNDLDNHLRQMLKYDGHISAGTKIPLPEGYHEVTEKEAVLLHEVVRGIRFELSEILKDNRVDMRDLE